jgi:hypothetical protein
MRVRIRDLFDPGSRMEKFGSRIRDKHPGYATLKSGNQTDQRDFVNIKNMIPQIHNASNALGNTVLK